MPLEVWDDVLPDPMGYWVAAQGQTFESVPLGDQAFHGIAPAPDTQLLGVLADLLGQDLGQVTTFLRQSPAHQVEPNYVHDDASMGQWTAILYLTPVPARGDGTVFYRALVDAPSWSRLTDWEPWAFVGARFNRLIKFPAEWPHSRAIVDNYGIGRRARLIQVMFGGA